MALFSSSTQRTTEAHGPLPRHVAFIMDGNGRWAQRRFLPRVMGHKKGLDTLRDVIRECDRLGVEFVTVFAFSSENWRRPKEEVSFLMGLFLQALQSEVDKMCRANIRLKIIGSRQRFDGELLNLIEQAEQATADNTGLTLTVAVDYGGRWDILNAISRYMAEHPQSHDCAEEDFAQYLSMAYAPEPDLFIRTGGEQRVSNFLLWQLAYAELYFSDHAWPDFGVQELNDAFSWYQARERRFGQTSQQISQ